MRYFIALSPGEKPPAGNLPIAHIGYRVGADGELLRAASLDCRGGIMVLDSGGCAPCKAIAEECRRRGFSGVLANFRPNNAPELLSALSERGVRLILHERDRLPGCRVLVSTAVSGGSYPERIAEAAQKYGAENIILDAEHMRARFFPPDPSGQGESVPLSALPKEGYCFSRELCCNYRASFAKGRACFLLFDDRAAMGKKLALAEKQGINKALFLPGEWT